MGFKNDWQTCDNAELEKYFNVVHKAFDMNLAVAILRVPNGLDCSQILGNDEAPKHIMEAPKTLTSNDSSADLLAKNSSIHGSCDSLSRNASQGNIEKGCILLTRAWKCYKLPNRRWRMIIVTNTIKSTAPQGASMKQYPNKLVSCFLLLCHSHKPWTAFDDKFYQAKETDPHCFPFSHNRMNPNHSLLLFIFCSFYLHSTLRFLDEKNIFNGTKEKKGKCYESHEKCWRWWRSETFKLAFIFLVHRRFWKTNCWECSLEALKGILCNNLLVNICKSNLILLNCHYVASSTSDLTMTHNVSDAPDPIDIKRKLLNVRLHVITF